MTEIYETWRRIEDYQDYEVSSLGRVRSLKFRKIKILKGCPDIEGYFGVYLCKYGFVKRFKVSRLVANTFIPNPEKLNVVNHKDGIKTNDAVSNLEWCTMEENFRHAIRTGLINNKGELNPAAKLTHKKAMLIKKEYAVGQISQRALARKFGISQRTVLRIVKYHTWGE